MDFASARGEDVLAFAVEPGSNHANDRGGADKLLLREGLNGFFINLEVEVPTAALLPDSSVGEWGGGSRTNSGRERSISGSRACSTVSGMASRMNSGRVSRASGFRILVFSEAVDEVL